MRLLSLYLAVVLTGCASTNTGNPVLDAANRQRNKLVAAQIGNGVVRFLSEPPPDFSLADKLFPIPPVSEKIVVDQP